MAGLNIVSGSSPHMAHCHRWPTVGFLVWYHRAALMPQINIVGNGSRLPTLLTAHVRPGGKRAPRKLPEIVTREYCRCPDALGCSA